MQNIDTRVRCHPFSNAPYVECKHCCHEMTLVSALVHIFKCHTCLHRRDTPDSVTPIFPADARGLDGYTGYQSAIIMILQSTRRYSSTGATRINPGHGTKIARGLVRYKDIGYCSIKSMSLLKPGATRCHGTRIARGVPLPVYMNLDLYSGFWCTSHCVVFKYSVPSSHRPGPSEGAFNQLERS